MPNESPDGRIQYMYDFYKHSALDTSFLKYNYVLETFTVNNATLNNVKKDGNFTIIINKFLSFLLKMLSLSNPCNLCRR